MRIIAIANQKGGCGKTTTAINLAASLAFFQKKALLIDLDSQGHATCGLGIRAEFLERTSYELFQEGSDPIRDFIVPINDYLSIIPTYIRLNQVEQENTAGQDCLKNRLTNLPEDYDYVIIDSPPHLGLLTFNAFTAAQEIIVPIEPSFFSLHGLAKIFETLDSVRQNQNKSLRIHALMTRFEKRVRLAREIHEEVRKYFKSQLFMNVIEENVRLKEAAASGKSIVDFDRNSIGFKNYMGLAIEVIERGLIWEAAERQVFDRKEDVNGLISEPPIVTADTSTHADQSESSIETEPHDSKEQAQTPSIETENAPASTNEKPSASDVTEEIWDANELRPKKVLGGILFSFLNKRALSVLIAGDFNRWVAESLMQVDENSGLWQKVLPISEGTYRYKFLVDDIWQIDPFNPRNEMNPYGGIDSVLQLNGSIQFHEITKETKTGTC